jgi:hypothetical protein
MKKRKISSIILLDIVTLGFYELYWLIKTRNNIVQKFGLNIPSAGWLIIAKTVQILCILFTVYAVFYAIPANNRRIDNLVRPSAECFREYSQTTVSQSCKKQADNYFQTDNTTKLLLAILGLYMLSFASLWLVLRRWFVPYANAMARATQKKISSISVIMLLGLVPSPIGMLIIQNTINKQ